ncbi:MAG: formate dehydrogenase accessory sulfurtransferase FdhD [Anaerolineales bacterium]|jgi:FdhD protein
MNPHPKKIKYIQYLSKEFSLNEAEIVEENPISLSVNGDDWLTFMCTPTDLKELGAGFLFNEGVISNFREIESIRLCQSGANIDIWLNKTFRKPKNWFRTSGCTGGVSSINFEEINIQVGSSTRNKTNLNPEQVEKLVELLFKSQNLYRKYGGIHTSALCFSDQITVSKEDIGRHNTLDKIAGFCLLNSLEMNDGIIVTTGRISSEMIQKCIRMGVSNVISRTSPSSLSIQLAKKFDITLIGYARKNQFRIYSNENRINLMSFTGKLD